VCGTVTNIEIIIRLLTNDMTKMWPAVYHIDAIATDIKLWRGV